MSKLWDYLTVMETALKGDLVLVATPATTGGSAVAINAAIAGTAAKYTRDVVLTLENAAGDIQTWFNGTMAVAVAEVTAGNGVSAMDDGLATVQFEAGVATATVKYTGAWAGGTAQTETQRITAGAITRAGSITVTVTSAALTAPKAVTIAVAHNDSAIVVATKIVAAINLDATILPKLVASNVGGTVDTVTLTTLVTAANDGTLAMGFVDTGGTGVTAGASTNGTAGVAKDTQTLTVTGGTVLGYTVANKTSVDTVVA